LYDEGDLSEILGASDPNDTDHTADLPEPEPFSLAYYTAEALNPYTSRSRTNSELLRLCYGGLFTVDGEYNALPVIAESYEVEGNGVTVKLRDDVYFSDGSPVTAADCEASYRRAAQKDSIWADTFSYLRSYEALEDGSFRIVFRSYAPTQLNLLTVPVVKAGTENGEDVPVGCGRYRFETGETLSLIKTSCNCVPGAYSIDRIALLGIGDQEAMIYNFNYGRLQAVYADLSFGAAEYRADNEIVTIPTGRMTFLVVNKSKEMLADVNFSRGLTYLIDRKTIVAEDLSSFAVPVWYPLNPAWSRTKAAGLNPDIFSTVSAGDAFTQAGLILDGEVRVYKKQPVTLRILVNRENASRVRAAQSVARALEMAGFTVEVVQAAWDEYQTAIKNLDFDLYVGEVNLPDNLDLSATFSDGVCNTGEEEGIYDLLREQAFAVLTGEEEVRTFVSSFQNQLPYVPLYYSLDALAVSMDVTGEFGGSVSEFYAGIENWVFTPR